ncbi:unnamed protein product [Effrenium voratum]|uniref:MalT-like TPR region domain-containing protein n=1 Tax=Effrenium voratum TaxID=2562239 RepID=A0AA36NF24_9DINO|nr:unnamed protein product [Effrenium voratum]CAJ1399773.1 unnamed protein product [Effrenium voratum]CAJ1455937.1 unnamed protein product [Effrenium voratum]
MAMRCKAFESAAAELVDESLHPLEQLDILARKVGELKSSGDTDAVIECRIKELSLQRVLCYLHQFPLQPLIQAQAALAEAYGNGGYYAQAKEHLAQAREVCSGGIYDEMQCQRLQADLMASEGAVCFAEGQLEAAERVLMDAARMGRETRGELDRFASHVHMLLGEVASKRCNVDRAIDHFSEAWQVHDYLDGASAEPTLRIRIRVAEAERSADRLEEAVKNIQAVVDCLKEDFALNPQLLLASASKLARWLEADSRDQEALEALQTAEAVAQQEQEAFCEEDPHVVDVKRDMALLHIKLGHHDQALKYLNEVHYFERRLHGSQSAQVARTLKALGTVHVAHGNPAEAERCLLQALRIFETDSQLYAGSIRDIHAKLASIGPPS